MKTSTVRCPYCPRTFRGEADDQHRANMLAEAALVEHLAEHHPHRVTATT